MPTVVFVQNMCAKPKIVAFRMKLFRSRVLFFDFNVSRVPFPDLKVPFVRISMPLMTALTVVCLCIPPASAQRAGIVFWNVENFYDTIPSPFYDDRAYTPEGANRWNTERYTVKTEGLARVLDELSADVAGLAEVENETVVRDLVRTMKVPYNYIHTTSGDSRGMDLALLYKGDRFFPDEGGAELLRSGTGREFLHVRGELSGKPIHLIVCHLASNLNSARFRERNMAALRMALLKLLADDPAARIVVMGDMNAVPGEAMVRENLTEPLGSDMRIPHYEDYASGRGSYNYRSRWYLYDWMMTSRNVKVGDAGIYVKRYMIDESGRPRRTFRNGDWSGGPSDHLPVYITIAP